MGVMKFLNCVILIDVWSCNTSVSVSVSSKKLRLVYSSPDSHVWSCNTSVSVSVLYLFHQKSYD